MRLFANDFHEWRSHEWKSSANHIPSEQKIVIQGNECIILFLARYFMSWTHNFAKKQSSIVHFAIVAKEDLFWLSIVTSTHSWSLTSREREVLALWRHIRRLFFHAQIGAKAIFTGEKQPSGIHGLACKKLYYLINIHSLSCHVWYFLKWLLGGSYYITCNILTWKEHPKMHLLLDLTI